MRPDLVVRPQLIAQLNEGLARKLTFVSAPAGFGKTTLVAAWIAQVARPFVWLSLDEDDNELLTLFTYLAAAIASIHGADTKLSTLTQGSQSLQPKSLATAFINDVTTTAPCGLVLDDYHVITNPAIHEAMTFILDHLPPTVHLVMTSRVDPLLPLPRMRVRGELTEVRTDDLRFSTAEMAEFLRTRTDVALSPQMLAALDTRTEGWIAGIHMAALSIQRMTNVDEVAQFMHDFARSHRLLGEFGEAIKRSLPAAEQNLIESLSPRELEVLQLLAGGYANQEIANELIVALSTAKRHVSNIYGKLGVGNRTTAVARARELDLL